MGAATRGLATGGLRLDATLTAAELAHYRTRGYVIVPGVLTELDLSPIEAAYEQQVGRLADRLVAEGRASPRRCCQ